MAHLKTRQEMANEYGVCVKTFIKKLKYSLYFIQFTNKTGEVTTKKFQVAH